MAPDDPRHGTEAGHTAHLRSGTKACEPCVRAHTRQAKLRELRPELFAMVPVVGARRRLQALQALGYSRERLARELGYREAGSLSGLMSSRSTVVTQRVFKRVTEVYDALSMQPPPAGHGPARGRRWAARHGYAPPLAWDDDTIDDPNARPHGACALRVADDHRRRDEVDEAVVLRVLAGEHMPTTRAEKEEILARHVEAGGSERALCTRLGWKEGRYTRQGVAA